jgi:2',3'-cyclic-nucleotide 2'-phosphodiesterase (5'-nucleotidase family)
LSVARLIHPTLVLLILLIASPVLFAQSAPIEPCPATPTAKPASVTPGTPTKVSVKASETIIDSNIAEDPDIEKLLRPYSDKVRALSVVIGRLENEMKKGTVGAGTLGQFVTDAVLSEARKRTGKNIVLALTNAGGLRKNQLITLDVTGAQLRKLGELTARNAQAGARVQFRWNDQNRTEVIETKLLDPNGSEIEIDSSRTYTIVTVDYLYKLNSGSFAILQEGKNLQPLNLTIRDAVVDYVKAETAAGRPIRGQLDNRFIQVGPGPSKPVTPPND